MSGRASFEIETRNSSRTASSGGVIESQPRVARATTDSDELVVPMESWQCCSASGACCRIAQGMPAQQPGLRGARVRQTVTANQNSLATRIAGPHNR